MIYYFSGTGNSLWCAHKLAELLKTGATSIREFTSVDEVYTDDDLLGLVFPVYCSDIPLIARNFMLKLKSRKNPYVFTVMTSNRLISGKSFETVDEALNTNGMHLSYKAEMQMPGNCLESTAEEDSDRISSAPERILNIEKDILRRTINYSSHGLKASTGYLSPDNSREQVMLGKCLSVDPLLCNGCGICTKVCPMKNISIRNGKAFHSDNCTACLSCLHWCPHNATSMNIHGIKSPRQYHHPDVSFNDIIK
jgi:ferredoxin